MQLCLRAFLRLSERDFLAALMQHYQPVASSAAMCQRAFCSLHGPWLAIFCGSYARTLRRRDLHCSTVHDVNLLSVLGCTKRPPSSSCATRRNGHFFPTCSGVRAAVRSAHFCSKQRFPNNRGRQKTHKATQTFVPSIYDVQKANSNE